MLKEVEIEILAEDIIQDDYSRAEDCAIAKALQRKFKKDIWAGKIDIIDNTKKRIKIGTVPKELDRLVERMYYGNADPKNFPKPRDFKAKVLIEEDYLNECKEESNKE